MDEMIKAGTLEKKYAGIMDCGKRVASEEGVKALWKGNGTNVLYISQHKLWTLPSRIISKENSVKTKTEMDI